MIKKLQFICSLLLINTANAQVTNTAFIDSVGGEKLGKLGISGWMDAYYAKSSYNWNRKTKPNDIPNLVSSSNYDLLDINLAYLDFRYTTDRIKIRLVPAFGSYMDKNYSKNSSLSKLMEASMSVKPFAKKDVWIEAGLIGSPFTNENPVSRDHIMYTRSLAAEYSPYYLTGIKLTAPITKKIKGSAYLLNGWQTIYEESNLKPAVATQLKFTVNQNNIINWNIYYQNRNSYNRVFSDIYWIGNWKRWKFTSCLYAGNDELKIPLILPKPAIYDRSGFWCNANIASSYSINATSNISGRIEYFQDLQNNVMGKIFGSTLGYNRKIFNQLYWRTELKWYSIEKEITQSRKSILNGVMSLGVGF